MSAPRRCWPMRHRTPPRTNAAKMLRAWHARTYVNESAHGMSKSADTRRLLQVLAPCCRDTCSCLYVTLTLSPHVMVNGHECTRLSAESAARA